ncbi:hypothetical protein D9M71_533350 [compost metagenome]
MSKSRRTSQSTNRAKTVPKNKCCRRLSLNNSTQGDLAAAQSSTGPYASQLRVRLSSDKSSAPIMVLPSPKGSWLAVYTAHSALKGADEKRNGQRARSPLANNSRAYVTAHFIA